MTDEMHSMICLVTCSMTSQFQFPLGIVSVGGFLFVFFLFFFFFFLKLGGVQWAVVPPGSFVRANQSTVSTSFPRMNATIASRAVLQ